MFSVSRIELPDTAAGNQLRWVLEESATAEDSAYIERFSQTFLDQVPVAMLRREIATFEIESVTEVVSSTDTELVVLASSTLGQLVITITVEAEPPNQIIGLLAQPSELPDPPETWAQVNSLLEANSMQWSYLAAEIAQDGSLNVIESGGEDRPVPLGSAFKIYVLGAVIDAIEGGELSWEDSLTITEDLKSLPSGELQDLPAGSTVSVREAAEKMIQISDNTATDLLINRVGRGRVEAMLSEMGMAEPSRRLTLPFLTTRELFTLKWGIPAESAAAYASASTEQREVILSELTAPLPGVAEFVNEPRFIDSIEWFASPSEMIAAHVWLDRYRTTPGFEPLDAILGDNPGVPLDPALWPDTAFKGGSEPGVLFLGWLLHDPDGRRVGVIVSARNDSAVLDENAIAAVGAGIIDLTTSKG